ncbi:PREDICTED: uncharacterized protein LOC109243957 [Nicotiana attenuata]|uniref:uncharacterized protein LOC109243957 n=1 Tax=Nicotiana attenuata TaxID=49451 RepID=UPI0009057F01|nr:PREDICTED: uncharacterized protein LOC109243957 [Nicotiana attenuata]
MDLPPVADDWAIQAFTQGLNPRSSLASQQLKQNLVEYPTGITDRPFEGREAPRLSGYNFNVDAASIVSAIGRIKETKWPRPLQSDPAQIYPNLMCMYHGTHGHRTKDCRQLREEVARNKDANKQAKLEEPQHVINMIIGGVDVPQGSIIKRTKISITREKRTRDYVSEGTILFNDEDAEGIVQPLNNVLETFDILKKYNIKMNPEKCAFGVGLGKFLGFMVSKRGIEINPDKIKTIEDITVVENVKAVQNLTGRIAALGRFISRSSDKSHWFFSLLKKKNNFSWTPKFQKVLEELKWYLSSPPMLHTPKADEQLYLYLVVSEVAVSGVFVREEEAT